MKLYALQSLLDIRPGLSSPAWTSSTRWSVLLENTKAAIPVDYVESRCVSFSLKYSYRHQSDTSL